MGETIDAALPATPIKPERSAGGSRLMLLRSVSRHDHMKLDEMFKCVVALAPKFAAFLAT